MTNEYIFPTELICQILGYTSARDVVRWRTVSKRFCAITYEPEVWKILHANARYMRPPELLRNTASLEQALVKSEQLTKLWTKRQLCKLPRSVIPFDGCVPHNANHLIGGRWFICQSYRRFLLYDAHLDATKRLEPRVLWEQKDDIICWVNGLAMYKEGRWAAYVLLRSEHAVRWNLLELWWDAESGLPCDTLALDVPCDASTENMIEVTSFNRSRFIYLPVPSLVFDTTNRVFYEFPPFSLALDQTRSRIDATTPETIVVVKLTNTHVIVLRYYARGMGEPIVVQAFIPDDSHAVNDGKGILRLTHEGVFESPEGNIGVVRNSATNPIDGSVNVRLLGRRQWWPSSIHSEGVCVELTMPKTSTLDVLPMTVQQHDIVVKGRPSLGNRYDACLDVTDEGYAMGLSVWDGVTASSTHAGKRRVGQFTIDATGDRCVVDYGDDMKPALHVAFGLYEAYGMYLREMALDGARGKLSYVNSGHAHSDGVGAMSVLDIKF